MFMCAILLETWDTATAKRAAFPGPPLPGDAACIMTDAACVVTISRKDGRLHHGAVDAGSCTLIDSS
jgi:hypothetical protein